MGGTGLLCREGLYHSHIVEWAAFFVPSRAARPRTLPPPQVRAEHCLLRRRVDQQLPVDGHHMLHGPARAASTATGAPWRSAAAAGVVIVRKPAPPALATNAFPNTQAGRCGVTRACYCQHKIRPVDTAEVSLGPERETPADNEAGSVGVIRHTAENEGGHRDECS